jgi:hypothetical protein
MYEYIYVTKYIMSKSVFLLRSIKNIEKIDAEKMTLATTNGYVYIKSFILDVFEIIVLSKKNYDLEKIKEYYFGFNNISDDDDDKNIYDHNWNKLKKIK